MVNHPHRTKTYPKTEWLKVNKDRPCKGCGKSDWCAVTSDLGLYRCMRVESPKPSRGGGWLHKADGNQPRTLAPLQPKPSTPSKPIDFAAMIARWQRLTAIKTIIAHAESLGVDPMAWKLLGASWSDLYGAWGIPMKNATGSVIGIRLRAVSGRKWAVKGSNQGLFIPSTQLDGRELVITEGPTDAAASLTLGFPTIGRPSCLGCEEMICEYVRLGRFSGVILAADNDSHGAGLRGAEALQLRLPVRSTIYLSPAKDLRECVKLGGTREMIESSIKNAVWQQSKKTR